ncbi:hypothetical protein [Clostridium sardiniense]|uniref:hypothetical protein n=1 Tax=Clostridium sardiniense TaxID=29369 RepID=UPI003D355FE8
MNSKESNKSLNNKIDTLTNEVKILEMIIKNSSSCGEILRYFGEGSSDYLDSIITNASQVLGE